MLATNVFSSHDERTARLFREKNKVKFDVTYRFCDAHLRVLEVAREISRRLVSSFIRLNWFALLFTCLRGNSENYLI